jgi:PKHD-type hydroxylase
MCDLIVKETDWKQSTEGSFYREESPILDHKKRKTIVGFVDPLQPVGCIMQSYISLANVHSNWNYATSYMEPVQIGRYDKGSHYDWHCDSFNPDEFGNQRKLSSVLFLSNPEDYEGGTLEIKELDNPLPRLPKGSIVVFPSVLPHRVTPVTSGMRYTAVAWAMGPAFR